MNFINVKNFRSSKVKTERTEASHRLGAGIYETYPDKGLTADFQDFYRSIRKRQQLKTRQRLEPYFRKRGYPNGQ